MLAYFYYRAAAADAVGVKYIKVWVRMPSPKIVIPVTLIPNKKWYFKKTSRSPPTIKEFGYAPEIVE